MIIKSLELQDYRNYNSLNLTFDKGTNILYGDNAQGKTNILEALYLTGTTKSHRGTKDRDLIKFGQELNLGVEYYLLVYLDFYLQLKTIFL